MTLRISFLIDSKKPVIIDNVKNITLLGGATHVSFTDGTKDICFSDVLGITPHFYNEG
jgi:hypothetical protein